jgi:hypothetical protein
LPVLAGSVLFELVANGNGKNILSQDIRRKMLGFWRKKHWVPDAVETGFGKR